jgi:hypothetical protein
MRENTQNKGERFNLIVKDKHSSAAACSVRTAGGKDYIETRNAGSAERS